MCLFLLAISHLPLFFSVNLPQYWPQTRWMTSKQFPGNWLVNRVAIPGTHDSAASVEDNGLMHGTDLHWQTQVWTIPQQLRIGVRFFDLRVNNSDTLPVFHYSVFQGTDIPCVFSNFVSFLRENPSEFIVIRLKQEYTGNGQTDVNFTARVFNATNQYPNYFLLNGNKIPTISQARGKVIVMTGFQDNRTIYFDGSNPILTIQDDYDQYWKPPGCCDKIASMKAQVVTADNSTNLWSISHATGYGETTDGQVPPSPGCSPRDVAYKTNKDVFTWLAVPSHHNWGILVFDFPSPGLISRVIALNY